MTFEKQETPSHHYPKCDMMITIVDRDLGDRVVECNQDFHIPANVVFRGRGTASSYWMDLLGLDSPEKDIVISFVPVEHAHGALANLVEKMDLHARGKGIVFTIPVNSVAGSRVLHYFTDISLQEDKNER